MRRSFSGSFAAVMLLAMTGCGSGGGSSSMPFQFRMSEAVAVGIAVTKAGIPLPGATVSLATPLTAVMLEAGLLASVPFFVGGTGDDGRCDTSITLPAELGSVDVIVNFAGATGAYTDEALRTLWGPLAPSARITVSVSALGNLTVNLEDA